MKIHYCGMEYFHSSLVMFYKTLTNEIPKKSSVMDDFISSMIVQLDICLFLFFMVIHHLFSEVT